MTATGRTFRRRLTIARAGITLVVVGAVPAIAGGQTSTRYAVALGSTWIGWADSAQVIETALATGGVGAQATIQTSYVSSPLLDLIAASVAGKSPTTPVQVASYSYTLSPVSLLKIGSTWIQEVDVPRADASHTGPALVRVKFAQAISELSKPTTSPGSNLLGQMLHANYFHLQFDSLDATTAISIAPMAIRLPDVLKGINLPQLVLTTAASSPVWNTGIQKWLTSQTARNGTLTFLASNLSTPLLVVRYLGVRVKSIDTSTGAPIVTFTMTGIRIQSAATP